MTASLTEMPSKYCLRIARRSSFSCAQVDNKMTQRHATQLASLMCGRTANEAVAR